MANPELLEILKKGVVVWNRWREENPEIIPDLIRADLQRIQLKGANLCRAELMSSNLSYANLSNSDLIGADLRGADLIEATFSEADLSMATLMGASLTNPKISVHFHLVTSSLSYGHHHIGRDQTESRKML
jgi:hypothetical protein